MSFPASEIASGGIPTAAPSGGMVKALAATAVAYVGFAVLAVLFAALTGGVSSPAILALGIVLAGFLAMPIYAGGFALSGWLLRRAALTSLAAYTVMGAAAPLAFWELLLLAGGKSLVLYQLALLGPAGLVGGWVLGRARQA